MKNVLFLLIWVAMLMGCTSSGVTTKHFSSQLASVDEPQTDDERTFIGEYNDYLVLVDSLADVWDSTDTLTMRRLYYNQREQQRRVEKLEKRPNIRHSMVEKVLANVEKVRSEIAQKFSPELRNELYVFHEFFDLNKHNYWNGKNLVDKNVYANSFGEHYFIVKIPFHEVIDGHLHTTEIITKQPITEKDYQLFMEYTKPKSQSKLDDDSYEVGDGKPMQEVELPDEAFASNAVKSSETNDTDWDVTETE